MRGDASATNVYDTLNRRDTRIPKQIKALRKAIRHKVETHGFIRILVYVRTSPSPKPTDKEGTNASIERQTEYLRHMLGSCLGIKVHFETAAGISASKKDSVDGLKRRLREVGEKVLVVTVRIDRTTRSVGEFERLQQIIADGGHGILSFLWDFQNSPQDVCLALRLPETDKRNKAVTDWEAGLAAQKRAPMVRLNRPVHQPILWMFREDTKYLQPSQYEVHC